MVRTPVCVGKTCIHYGSLPTHLGWVGRAFYFARLDIDYIPGVVDVGRRFTTIGSLSLPLTKLNLLNSVTFILYVFPFSSSSGTMNFFPSASEGSSGVPVSGGAGRLHGRSKRYQKIRPSGIYRSFLCRSAV